MEDYPAIELVECKRTKKKKKCLLQILTNY